MNNTQPISFTVGHDGKTNVLITDVIVHPFFDPKKIEQEQGKVPPGRQYRAIWDTGATATVITKRVARDCALKPISMTRVQTAGGMINSNVYLVNIMLPNKVGLPKVRVSEAEKIGEDSDVLIGMDIITAGDFAITNRNKRTVFSYGIPSIERIDFVKRDYKAVVARMKKEGPNAPCPCGSGKKYKKCCKDDIVALSK